MEPHARVRPSGYFVTPLFGLVHVSTSTILVVIALLAPWTARAVPAVLASSDSARLRYAELPRVTLRSDGAAEWSASIDCAAPVDPVSLLGAYVAFARDSDLDGVTDAVDTSWVSPADCGEPAPGRLRVRRRFPESASVLRTMLHAAADSTPAVVHDMLTGRSGSLLGITRYCARPKNGEPEWIAVTNRGPRSVSLARVRLEGRALGHAGVLDPGATFVAGADTAELRLWQPGARLVGLSSWASLRNTGDTLRLVFEAMPVGGKPVTLVLDSVVYGVTGFDGEACASLATEGSGAAAGGFELVLPAARGGLSGGLIAEVRTAGTMPYDLDLYDLDGAPVCRLARAASGSATYTISTATCARGRGRAGTYILHLRPHGAPGVRKPLRLAP